MKDEAPFSIYGTVKGSYAYLRGALLPALAGSLLYALVSFISDYVLKYELFGVYSFAVSFCLLGCMGVFWLAMALREGLGEDRKGILGLSFGRQEFSLGLSILGFGFVMGLIVFLVGFFVFLFIMIIALIGGGGLSGADVASAPIYESSEAFRAFLTGTSTGRVVAGIVGLTLAGAFGFLLWFVLRLSPFAAGSVSQQRFVVLQAMTWTRYKDRALMGAGIVVIGVAGLAVIGARRLLGLLPLPDGLTLMLGHLLLCFAALLIVGFVCQVYRQTATPRP